MYSSLFTHQLTDTLIITANHRLAAYLRQKNAPGHTILSLDNWLQICHDRVIQRTAERPRILLSNLQAQTIWETIIKESPIGETLLDIRQTAQRAKQAWELLKQWRLPYHSFEFS